MSCTDKDVYIHTRILIYTYTYILHMYLSRHFSRKKYKEHTCIQTYIEQRNEPLATFLPRTFENTRNTWDNDTIWISLGEYSYMNISQLLWQSILMSSTSDYFVRLRRSYSQILARYCPHFPHYLPAKTQKTENSNLLGFQLHRPSSKGTKLLLQVIKAIINQ